MAATIRTHLRRRRLQRWIRKEALLLAREADTFGCDEMRQEASRLLHATTGSVGGMMVLRTA